MFIPALVPRWYRVGTALVPAPAPDRPRRVIGSPRHRPADPPPVRTPSLVPSAGTRHHSLTSAPPTACWYQTRWYQLVPVGTSHGAVVRHRCLALVPATARWYQWVLGHHPLVPGPLVSVATSHVAAPWSVPHRLAQHVCFATTGGIAHPPLVSCLPAHPASAPCNDGPLIRGCTCRLLCYLPAHCAAGTHQPCAIS